MPVCAQSRLRPSRFTALVLIPMLLLVALRGEVAELTGLYSAEVPVAGQDAASRNHAIGEAFQLVLTKVTGREEMAEQQLPPEKIQSASTYVQQYRYRVAPLPTDAPTTASVQRLLQVQFDPQAVNRLLTEQTLPIWGVTRPLVLIWLGIEETGNRHTVMPGQDPQLTAAIEKTAEERGLPILMPLLDLEDQSRLQAEGLWGKSVAPVREASQRYEPDLILVATFRHTSGPDWYGNWTLLTPQGIADWNSKGMDKKQAAVQGMRELADRLAAHYAPVRAGNEPQALRLRITDIRQLSDYERIERFLQNLDSVAQVELQYAEPEAVVFSLQVRGGRESLEREIGLGGLLRPEPNTESQVTATNDATPPNGSSPTPNEEITLYYRLQP